MTRPNDPPPPGSVVDDFLRHRNSNSGTVELRNFLNRHPDLSIHDQLELLLIDRHVGWRLGCIAPVEEYLREFPEILADSQSVADLLYGDWRAGGMRGVPHVSDSLAQQFPDLPGKLTYQVELLNWLCDEAVELCQPAEQLTDQQTRETARSNSVYTELSEEPILAAHSNKSWRRPTAYAAALATLAVIVLIAIWWPVQKGNEPPGLAPSALSKQGSAITYELSWTLDLYRGGDLNRQERLTSAPASALGGDAIRLSVRLDEPAFLYVYTIDPVGNAALVGMQNPLEISRPSTFPLNDAQAIPVPRLDGTMLCVVIARDKPLDDTNAVTTQLRIPQPLPNLASGTLLVDGAPLKSERSIIGSEGDYDDIQLAELRKRLGDQFASRSVGPADPVGEANLAHAIKIWYGQLPKELGDIHYLAFPVVIPAP